MINLIPPEGQKVVKREYIFRVGGTLSFLLGGVFLVLTVALIPTYVLIGAQISSSSVEANKDRGEEVAFEKADGEVTTAKNLLRQLKAPAGEVSGSDAIEEIQGLATSDIFFRTFQVGEQSGKISTIQVQGTASTRESLAKLKNSIEASPTFTKAEVPIADLARDVNLPFTVTITLSEES